MQSSSRCSRSAYLGALKAQGVDALFLSINGAIRDGFPRGSSRAAYETFQRPFDLALLQLRTLTDRCLMGGLDETRLQERTLPSLAREVDDALAQAGRKNFILAPGCTLPSFSPERTLRFLRQYTREV